MQRRPREKPGEAKKRKADGRKARPLLGGPEGLPGERGAEQGVTDSVPGKLLNLEGLGFLNGSNCPHYDGEAERRGAYHQLLKEGMKSGYACDDGVAAHFIDGELAKFVSSRPTAKAYEVKYDGQIYETTVEPDFLTDF